MKEFTESVVTTKNPKFENHNVSVKNIESNERKHGVLKYLNLITSYKQLYETWPMT